MSRCQVNGCRRAAMFTFNGERCRVCGFCMHDRFGGRNPGTVSVARLNSGLPDLVFFDEVDKLPARRDWRKDRPLGVPASAWAMPAGSLPGPRLAQRYQIDTDSMRPKFFRQCAKAYSFGVAGGLSPSGRTLETCYEQIAGRMSRGWLPKRGDLPPVLDPYEQMVWRASEEIVRALQLRPIMKKWDGWR